MEMLKTVLEGNLMQQIIQYMLTDIIEVFQYIPDGVMSGILFFVFVLIVKGILRLLKLDGKLSITRCAVMSFLAAYLVIFLEIVFLSREPGPRTGVDLQLFETWGTNAQAHAYVIENILLFIPVYFTTVNKNISSEEQYENVFNEISSSTQFIYEFRNKHCTGYDTFLVYIVNIPQNKEFSFIICKYESEGLKFIDKVRMFSLKSTLSLAIDNEIF